MEKVGRRELEEMNGNPGGSGRMQHVHRSTAPVGAGLEADIRQIRHTQPRPHHEGFHSEPHDPFPVDFDEGILKVGS